MAETPTLEERELITSSVLVALAREHVDGEAASKP